VTTERSDDRAVSKAMDWLRNAAAAAQTKAQEVSKQAQVVMHRSGPKTRLPRAMAKAIRATPFAEAEV